MTLDLTDLLDELEGRTADPWAYLLMTLAQAHLVLGQSRRDRPAWIPFLGPTIRSSGANPDTEYGVTLLDAGATYRVSGHRGNAVFCDLLAQAGLGGLEPKHGPTVTTVDLTDLPADADGRFTVVLGPVDGEITPDVTLDPRADHLWLRQVYLERENRTGAVRIERLDLSADPLGVAVPVTPEAARSFVENYVRLFLGHVDAIAARGLTNELELVPLPDETGGVQQSYFQGLFDLEQGHALVLETTVPDPCGYWSVCVTDFALVTPDWRHHACAINGGNAELAPDRSLRVVISPVAPDEAAGLGDANWIDTAGLRRGTILGRWNRAPEHPLPRTRLVDLRTGRDVLRA